MREIYLCTCIFKDARCGYRGRAKYCDKTLRRCNQLGNAVNYRGGLQPIPTPEPHYIYREVDLVVASLRELADKLEKTPSILSNWEISVAPLSAEQYRQHTISVSIYI
jgi:hypothetical protein